MTRLRLYLDDCSIDGELVRQLCAVGHTVILPRDVGLAGNDDDVHFSHTSQTGFVLLTHNPNDFVHLLLQDPNHPGVLGVYQDNNVKKDMNFSDIVRAIDNLLASGLDLRGGLHPLNPWRFGPVT